MASPVPRGRGTNPRRLVWAGAFAAVVIVGTISGARLKEDRDLRKAQKKVVEATADQKIAMLMQRRKQLEIQQAHLHEKLDSLHERMKAKEAKDKRQ